MRDVPALVGRTGDVPTRERTRKLRKRCHTPACFSLFPFCFLSLVFSPSSFLSLLALLLPQLFPFAQLNTINELNLRSIQTLCLHLSYSTPLRKTQTINHYLRIEYFQHHSPSITRVICHGAAPLPFFLIPGPLSYSIGQPRNRFQSRWLPPASGPLRTTCLSPILIFINELSAP